MQGFNEEAFKSRVTTALSKVKTILDNSKQPQYAATDVQHEYEDKYILAEFLVSTGIASTMNVLTHLGVSSKTFAKLKEWSKTRSVSLRFKAEEKCKFLRKVEREVESDTKHVSTNTIFGKSTSYTVTKIKEWFWQFDVSYEIIAFQGSDADKGEVIASRSGTIELKTTSESTPKPASVVRPNIDVNISWLLQHLDENSGANFKIDRTAKSCHTPRRNSEVDGVLGFYSSYYRWCEQVNAYFSSTLFPVQTDHGLDLGAIKDQGIFVPVLPLFDKRHKKEKKEKKEGECTPLSFI